jgi:hypothetical protein
VQAEAQAVSPGRSGVRRQPVAAPVGLAAAGKVMRHPSHCSGAGRPVYHMK